MKPATVPHTRLMKAATELVVFGRTTEAQRIINENPNGSDASWSGVFRKLVGQLVTLQTGHPIHKPAFSIFAKGNSKLPFYAFSSMAVLDCGGRGDCEHWCYSKSAWRNPNAAGRQISNSMLLRYEAGRMAIASAFMKLPYGITFRLYVDGDFHSVDNLRYWMDRLKVMPDIQAYGYSKSWDHFLSLQLDGYAWPANYQLNLSSGSRFETMPTMRDLMMQLPITRGEFIAVPVAAEHIKSGAYKSRHADGFAAYAKAVRSSSDKRRVFVCSGQCGDCLPDGSHACGSARFRNVPIAIGVH